MPSSHHLFAHDKLRSGRPRPSSRILVLALIITSLLPSHATFAQQAPPVTIDQIFQEGAEAFRKGNYPLAIQRFDSVIKQAEPGPALESVHFSLADAKLRLFDFDAALTSFQQYLRLYPNGAQVNDARIGIAKSLLGAKRLPEAVAALDGLRRLADSPQGVDNLLAVQILILGVADELLTEGKREPALRILQSAPSRAQMIESQTARVSALSRQLAAAEQSAGGMGASPRAQAARDGFATRLDVAKTALAQIEQTPALDLAVLLRLGRCFQELDQPWAAIVAYRDALTRFPEEADRHFALYGLVLARRAIGQLEAAQDLAERYITEFPSSPIVGDVAALGGQIALERENPAAAATLFGRAAENATGKTREQILFQLGSSHFAARNWALARASFDRYLKEYPAGEWIENALYRSALTWMLAADYEPAEKALLAFIKKYPHSPYTPDAAYRVAVCAYAYQEYERALAATRDWETRYPGDGLLGEVLSLQGDILKTLNRPEEAKQSYLRAASAAINDEVLDYTLGEAARILETARDWPALGALFTAQLERDPNSKLALGWTYWVARAKSRAGSTDEAWLFLADRVGADLANPAKGDVERVLSLMAQIQAKTRRLNVIEMEGFAQLPDWRPSERVREHLKLPPDGGATLQARLDYYDSRVALLSRKPAEAEALLLKIGRATEPAQLSATLLAEIGEALLRADEAERAHLFFTSLLDRFPTSDQRDYAYVGLGELALRRDDATAALRLFNDAIDKAGAPQRLREATLGQARAHFALGELDKAETLFRTIASTKEWRGEPTAQSLFYLGEIALRQDKFAEANAFFQRVFVSQGRHTEWVARSYLGSATALERLGQPADAVKTYQEMLRNERLAQRPELETARQQLARLAP